MMGSYQTNYLTFETGTQKGTYQIRLNRNGEQIWEGSLLGMALPVTNPPAVPEDVSVEYLKDRLCLSYRLPGISDRAQTIIEFGPRGIYYSTQYVAASNHTLERVDVFAPGTKADLHQVVHFRNIHHLPNTWYPTALAGKTLNEVLPNGQIRTIGELSLATDSSDLQFAPHPSALVFTKLDDQLVVACLGLPQGYGFRVHIQKPNVFARFEYVVGDRTFGIAKGQTVQTPTFFISCCLNEDPHEGFKLYTRELLLRGEVTPLTQNPPDWWFEPYYGTWGDQAYRASRHFATSEATSEGEAENSGDEKELPRDQNAWISASSTFREEMVDQALSIITQQKLPIGMIGVDDGWQVALGDWQPHPKRVRDMRALVERIHAAHKKAILWWVPFDVAPDAQLLSEHPEWFSPVDAPISKKYRNVWNQPFMDYSNPVIQTEYLFPLLDRIFGKGPGQWNYDGLKLDFNAMKIFPNMTFHDRDWHGEERYLYRASKLIYDYIKTIKPDAWIMGCTAHPYFSMAQDFCRTYDVHNSDYRAHRERGRMISALTVGNYLTYDFHFCSDRFEDYLRLCQEDGVGSQIASLVGFGVTGGRVTDAHFDMMRRWLVPGQRRTT